MKRILTALALIATISTAHAGYYGHHHHHYRSHGGGWGWIAPAVIGGLVVYGATRPAQAEPQPVIIIQGNQSSIPQVTCPQGTYPTWSAVHDTNGFQTGYQFMGCQPR